MFHREKSQGVSMQEMDTPWMMENLGEFVKSDARNTTRQTSQHSYQPND
jgi:hypothetical protein